MHTDLKWDYVKLDFLVVYHKESARKWVHPYDKMIKVVAVIKFFKSEYKKYKVYKNK